MLLYTDSEDDFDDDEDDLAGQLDSKPDGVFITLSDLGPFDSVKVADSEQSLMSQLVDFSCIPVVTVPQWLCKPC